MFLISEVIALYDKLHMMMIYENFRSQDITFPEGYKECFMFHAATSFFPVLLMGLSQLSSCTPAFSKSFLSSGPPSSSVLSLSIIKYKRHYSSVYHRYIDKGKLHIFLQLYRLRQINTMEHAISKQITNCYYFL